MNEPQNNEGPQQDLPAVPSQSELERKLAETEKQRDEYLSGWQRAKADFSNYKKDELARLAEMAKYGNEELIRELIVLIDNFDLGIAALEKAGPVEKGVYMLRTQLEDILKKRGLARIVVKPAAPFDPAYMESVAETEGDGPPGSVADEIEPGYLLNEKVIRPARVRLIKEK